MTQHYTPATDESWWDDPAETALMEIVHAKWSKLPSSIKRRWWEETQYSAFPLKASKELLNEMGIEA